MWPTISEDLVLVHQLLRGQHRLLGVVARVLDDQLDLAAVDAALLVDLVDAQRMPLRAGLPKPASGPDRSWIVPITISFLLTPCESGPRRHKCQGQRGRDHRDYRAHVFRPVIDLGAAPHAPRYIDSIRSAYFWFDELALELHRRRQFLVLGGELLLDQAELLDLLDPGELRCSPARSRARSARCTSRRAGQAGVVGERHVVVLRDTSRRSPGRS